MQVSKIVLVAALASVVAVSGCSRGKKGAAAFNSPADLGIGADGAGSVAAGSAKDFTVNVGDRVFFTVDSSSLTAEARSTLNKQAQWLARYPAYAIKIEGHADERGTREYNIALGARRAAATKNYLISQGVSRARLRTISYGKERPVAVCNDISCFSQNRRAVTLLSGGNSS